MTTTASQLKHVVEAGLRAAAAATSDNLAKHALLDHLRLNLPKLKLTNTDKLSVHERPAQQQLLKALTWLEGDFGRWPLAYSRLDLSEICWDVFPSHRNTLVDAAAFVAGIVYQAITVPAGECQACAGGGEMIYGWDIANGVVVRSCDFCKAGADADGKHQTRFGGGPRIEPATVQQLKAARVVF